jgi:hypothetical protein
MPLQNWRAMLRHMDLMDILKSANGGQNIEALASQFGLSGDQAGSVVGQLLPALTQGLARNTAQQGGLESLLGALTSGNHSRYIDDPSTLADPNAIHDGNGILGHLLGSKDVSRSLAQHVSGSTGVSDSLIKQMLPLVASMAMGALAKQQSNNAQAASPLEGLAGMLDFDKDGSAADDVIGLMGKLFGR